MTGSLTLCGDVASQLPETEAGGAPEWIELLRPGLNLARDGRRFALNDPQAVIAASLKDGAELPVDYDHQTERKGTTGPVPAAGWITELAERAGGIWAKVSWTADAARMIANREYRFVSPSMYTTKNGVVHGIKGAGLVHWPALNLTQLASREDPMADPDDNDIVSFTKVEIAELLGVAADTVTASALKTRLRTASPDPARFVPIDAVKELLASRNEAQLALTSSEAASKVDEACRTGAITPAMRPWALELCRSDPEAFDGFLKVTPSFGYLMETHRPASGLRTAQRQYDADTLALCRQLDIRPEDLEE